MLELNFVEPDQEWPLRPSIAVDPPIKERQELDLLFAIKVPAGSLTDVACSICAVVVRIYMPLVLTTHVRHMLSSWSCDPRSLRSMLQANAATDAFI